MNWAIIMAFGFLSADGCFGEDPSWISCCNQQKCHRLRWEQHFTPGHQLAVPPADLLHGITLGKPGATDYKQCFITDSSQLEQTSYFWWRSVQKDFPVKQEACSTFKAQIWLVLNLRHWTSEGSQLVGCSSTEREQSRKKLTLATSSYLHCWEHIHSDHMKIHKMVKLEGRAVSPGWTVSTSSWTVGTALWQLLATISPGLQTTTKVVHWGWPKDRSM